MMSESYRSHTVDLTNEYDVDDVYDSTDEVYDELDELSEFNIKNNQLRYQQSPNANHFYNPQQNSNSFNKNTTATSKKNKPFTSNKLYHDTTVSSTNASNINTQLLHTEYKQSKHKILKDRSDRATIEHVLDNLTYQQINKLFINKYIYKMNGCISTGKESNIYSVQSIDVRDNTSTIYNVLKIYKTSILVFKDRDLYITGEQRFTSYSKNPRKMVKLWAEKEYRNLKRLQLYGINSCIPIILRSNVLLISIIGDSTTGTVAPKLKDSVLSIDDTSDVYLQCIKLMRNIYIKCRLVHGDLSEYNLLVKCDGSTHYKPILYVIDVSQSVEHEHPYANELLKKDCINISHYFMTQHIYIMTVRELYTFVTTEHIDNVEQYIDDIMYDIAHNRCNNDIDPDLVNINNSTSQNEFVQTHIPRTLSELHDYEQTNDTIQAQAKNNNNNTANDIIIDQIKNLAIHNTNKITATTVTSAGNKTNKQKISFAIDLLPLPEYQSNDTPNRTDDGNPNSSSSVSSDELDGDMQNNVNQRRVRFVPKPIDNHHDDSGSSEYDSDCSDNTNTSDADTSSGDIGICAEWVDRPVLTSIQLKQQRKLHKKNVKLLQAEKRKDKIPKKIKKMKTKKHHK